jgi:thioredoxin 2
MELSPEVRLAKLNTEDEQAIAGNLSIRSIPTMVLFKNGREVTRQAGAMNVADIKTWVKNSI